MMGRTRTQILPFSFPQSIKFVPLPCPPCIILEIGDMVYGEKFWGNKPVNAQNYTNENEGVRARDVSYLNFADAMCETTLTTHMPLFDILV